MGDNCGEQKSNLTEATQEEVDEAIEDAEQEDDSDDIIVACSSQ